MRKAHAGIVVASLVFGACASSGEVAGSGSGAETSSAATSTGTGSAGSPGAGGETSSGVGSSTGTSSTSSTADAPPGSRESRRAILAPERLATCTPEGAGLVDVTTIGTRVQTSLGGCGFRSSSAEPTAEAPASLQLDVFDTTSAIADLLACVPGMAPDLDFATTTYGTFTSSHVSSESWEVAFAVDDGERVHVGMRLRRTCQGVEPTNVNETLAIEVDGRGRSITLHRCEAIRTRCPAVP